MSVFQQVSLQALRWGWPNSDKVSGLPLKELRSQKGHQCVMEGTEVVMRFGGLQAGSKKAERA